LLAFESLGDECLRLLWESGAFPCLLDIISRRENGELRIKLFLLDKNAPRHHNRGIAVFGRYSKNRSIALWPAANFFLLLITRIKIVETVSPSHHPNEISTSKSELYNPATGKYTATGNMPSNRQEQAAVLLPSGSVLVVGGNNVTANTTTPLATCATYNPTTGKWAAASTMNNARADHTATLLHNGHVLAAGGDNNSGELDSAELF
jgi:hypothetical protein